MPITIVGLDGRSDNTALAARLPVYASPQFTPAPQQNFLIVGTVRDQNSGINGQNIGVPNVALVLSGPVEATTATDLAGTFMFRDLPPGRYSLTPLPVGFTAGPGGTTVVTDEYQQPQQRFRDRADDSEYPDNKSRIGTTGVFQPG